MQIRYSICDQPDHCLQMRRTRVKLQSNFGAMQSEGLQRIRMLENRMRRPSKVGNIVNEESLKSIKSTDSKKVLAPVLHRLTEEIIHEETPPPLQQHIRLSEQQIKANRKITDYFPTKKETPNKFAHASPISQPVDIQKHMATSHSQAAKSPRSPDECSRNGQDGLKEQIRVLRETLKEREDMLANFRNQIVQSTIQLHKIKRNELRLRVSNNKIRLGEYFSYKGGAEAWVDGTEIRQFKQKIQIIVKEKEALQKSKRQARRGKDLEESQEWKISLNSQAYFLSRQELHCQQMLKRLQQQKAVHTKEYRLIYEEENSRYGKQVANGGNWAMIRKYQLLGLLGKGGFSEVYKAYDIEELREVAVKIHEFNPKWNPTARDNYVKHAIRENNVHKILNHPNIVRLYDTVEIDPNSFCTVLQFCEGPDLSFYLKKHKKISEKEAKLIIRQVINAIRYLHELPDKVIHYDLKPQNILFHKGRVKITDFGLCKITKEQTIELTSQGVGTYWYLPPECFINDQKIVTITPKVDVWSIGVIYFQMLYGEKPFGNAMSQMRILNQGIMLKAHSVNFPNTQKGLISNQSKEFIKECLEFKAEQRLDIRAVASHRLFEKK